MLPMTSKSVWRAVALAAVLLLGACAPDTFDRSQAIVALETTGVSQAEATCMADTLSAIDLLDAADPRRTRTADDQAGLVQAASRCIRTEVLPETVAQEAVDVADAAADAFRNSLPGPAAPPEVMPDIRQAAIEKLKLFGRSTENATCIVDRMVLVGVESIFEDPSFGMGFYTFEADAFASCM